MIWAFFSTASLGTPSVAPVFILVIIVVTAWAYWTPFWEWVDEVIK
jgi:hypothetical protein